MFSSPFTGYLPVIFMGSAFNNYISYKSLLFSDMLCSTPSSLSRPCWIFCYIFRDLDVSWFLPLIFVFIQHLNHSFVDVYVNVWYFHNVLRFVFVCSVFWVEFQCYGYCCSGASVYGCCCCCSGVSVYGCCCCSGVSVYGCCC